MNLVERLEREAEELPLARFEAAYDVIFDAITALEAAEALADALQLSIKDGRATVSDKRALTTFRKAMNDEPGR